MTVHCLTEALQTLYIGFKTEFFFVFVTTHNAAMGLVYVAAVVLKYVEFSNYPFTKCPELIIIMGHSSKQQFVLYKITQHRNEGGAAEHNGGSVQQYVTTETLQIFYLLI